MEYLPQSHRTKYWERSHLKTQVCLYNFSLSHVDFNGKRADGTTPLSYTFSVSWAALPLNDSSPAAHSGGSLAMCVMNYVLTFRFSSLHLGQCVCYRPI